MRTLLKFQPFGLALALSGILVFSACANDAGVRTRVSPQIGGRVFHRLMVVVNFGDAAVRRDAERQFRKAMAERGVEAVLSSELFRPGRKYSPEEVKQEFEDSKIEAVLIVSADRIGTTPISIPELRVTEQKVSTNPTSVATAPTLAGGLNFTKMELPWADFDASLLDAHSGATIWSARLESSREDFVDWSDLAKWMARETVRRLFQGRLPGGR